MINIEEQIKLLVELQGLDTHIFKLENELESIPKELKELDEELKEKTDAVKNMEGAVKALQLKRGEKEVDLESKEGTAKKYQVQLYQVKTNKEYTALEQEIARVKADNSLIEEDIIKILDQIDAENKKIAKEREELKSEEARIGDVKKEKGSKAKIIEAELANLKNQRNELASKVDKSILAKYERIINSKDGQAVVPALNETCQGCFRVMPPQVINEIRMKRDLILCDNCARILYIEE